MKNSRTTGSLSIGFLFDDTLDSDDGVAQQVKTFGAWLGSRGHQVSYLVGQTHLKNWQGGKVYSLSRNLKVIFNGNRMTTPLLASRQSIRQALNDCQPDVLHVQLPCSPFMAGRVLKAADARTAIFGTFHILPSGRLSVWGSKLLSLLSTPTIKRLDGSVSVSPAAATFAENVYKLAGGVLPNAVDISKFSVPKLPASAKPRIVFLGRLVKRKGCAELIEAAAHLLKVRGVDNFELLIAGDGPERASLEKLTNELGLSNYTAFLGYIEEIDKPKLLVSATIACFPSLYGESFGIVLLEAMAAGANVVLAGDNPGYRSVLGQKPKLLIDARRTEEFSARLEHFLESGTESKALRHWLASEVRRYDVNVVGPQLEKLYGQAIAKHRSNL